MSDTREEIFRVCSQAKRSLTGVEIMEAGEFTVERVTVYAVLRDMTLPDHELIRERVDGVYRYSVRAGVTGVIRFPPGRKAEMGKSAIERVSKAHAEAVKPKALSPFAEVHVAKPKPKITVDLDQPSGELPPAVATVKESGTRIDAKFPAAIGADLARETPAVKAHPAQTTLEWLRARREKIALEKHQLDIAIGALEQLLETA